jgi:uncharacterized protein with HEPN domain
MREDDAIRLRHMLDAAREAIEFAQGRTRVDLNGDRKLVLALVKDIEIVGEVVASGEPKAVDDPGIVVEIPHRRRRWQLAPVLEGNRM